MLQDNRLVDLPLSRPFLKLMCRGDITNNVNEKIGLTGVTQDSMSSSMVSSFMSEESEQDNTSCSVLEPTPWYDGILDINDLAVVDPVRGEFLKQIIELTSKRERYFLFLHSSLFFSFFSRNLSDDYSKLDCRFEIHMKIKYKE